MLKRKAYDYLVNWKKTKNKETLLINGARQVGKTFIIREFGKNEYKSFIEINFVKDPSLKDIFSSDLNPEQIYKNISLYINNTKLIPNNTLIFLDEIQKCSRARTALKFLAEDNKYDFIASGSLLGLSYGTDADKEVEEVESIPVGYEKQYTMYSLDFEEFLWSKNYTSENLEELKKYFISGDKVPESINSKFESYFREYIIVGGMPEVVEEYIKTNDFNSVREKQKKILDDYKNDITNHAKKIEKPKISRCYENLPNQLTKENKKFSYSSVEKGTGSKKYGDSITWLEDANFVYRCNNLHEPNIPLRGNSIIDEFKLYISDTGLLMYMFGDEAKKLVLNGNIKGNAKGGIYENIIAECLIKKGYNLNYYKDSKNTQEIEFLIEKDGEVIPIEVKAGNTSTISLNTFIDKNKPSIAYKLINGNVGFNGVKHTLPHYMILFI